MFLGVGALRPLYGTMAVLVIAGLISGMPLGVQIIKSGLLQLGSELEEASRIVGASWWMTYRRIVLRLMAPTLMAVGMITLVGAARNIGTFLCTKHVARLMVEQKRRGSIIVIASTAAHQGQPGNIAYCTSKSGLLNFARAAAMDLVKHGIRVNSLTPTATDVGESHDRAVEWGRPRPERRARLLDFAKLVPTGELPSPRHYARAAVFLASDDVEMITGFDLRVDAGAIAKYWPWMP
jgi:NAD(P)-dependent dehydrogenase (short-subunit alcohol dehydrogenase family)